MNKNLLVTAVGCLVVGGAMGYGLGMSKTQNSINFDTQSVKGTVKTVEQTKTTEKAPIVDEMKGNKEMDAQLAKLEQERMQEMQAEFDRAEAQEAKWLASDPKLSQAAREPFGGGRGATDEVSARSACANIADIPELECQALTELYWSTNGPHWTRNDNWLQNNSACTWYGVSCSNGHVFFLNLGGYYDGINYKQFGNNLSGIIPDSIGNLSELWNMDFSYGYNLYGSIPESIGNLKKLNSLSITNSDISGPIPSSLGNANLLSQITLENNDLSGPIPSSLQKLELGILDLDGNNIGGSLDWLMNMQFYPGARLELEGNKISGPIPNDLGKYKFNILLLSRNQLSGPIPASLSNLKDSSMLGLQGNKLCGYVPDSFAMNWRKAPYMKLYNNKLMTKGYNLMMTNWLAANVNFGTQDSTECEVIKPYCGDGICQADEVDKSGKPICTLDCKGPVRPDTPKGDGGMYY